MIEKMKKRGFDGVKTMREIRDRVSAEIMTSLITGFMRTDIRTRFCGVWRADARKIIRHRVGSRVGIS